MVSAFVCGISGRVHTDMEQFDAIIAGAGFAGLAAASTLSSEGLEVLILECGDYPGAKNVTGGRLYVNPLRSLFPGLWERVPLERQIVHESSVLMARERSVTVTYSGDELWAEPHQSHSILRAKFDRWFAEQAEAKGAMLMAKVRVDDLIQERGAVVGVRAGGEELRAPVVIACFKWVVDEAYIRRDSSRLLDFSSLDFKISECDRNAIEEAVRLRDRHEGTVIAMTVGTPEAAKGVKDALARMSFSWRPRRGERRWPRASPSVSGRDSAVVVFPWT